MSDNKETTARVLGAIRDFAAMKPEDGETWESWYAAAFDLLGDKVGDLLGASTIEHDNSELASMTRMFHAACADLGLINEALGLDPNDGGAEPILDAIEELKTAAGQAPAVEAGVRDERAAFEAFVRQEYCDSATEILARRGDGYTYSGIDDAWTGWQARAALARASEAAAGQQIYQARQHSYEEGTWDDVQEATYLACVAEPKFYEARIVYAAPIGDNRAQPAESKRVELDDCEIHTLARQYLRYTDGDSEVYGTLAFARALLDRSQAKEQS